MIKINLLESVTDKQSGAAAAVEKKVASPASKLLLMTLSVTALLTLFIGLDVIYSWQARDKAQAELEEQKKIASQLEAMLKEQKDLEQKIENINIRIEAIKKLRQEQAGPSAVLNAMVDRIKMVEGLYLESIEQKGEQLTIKGNSPDESAVTRFGQSLEFSSGLFSNLTIETQRKEIQSTQVSSSSGTETPKVEIVNFTIRCAYTPSKAGSANNSVVPASAENPGQQQQGASNQPQVAKN